MSELARTPLEFGELRNVDLRSVWPNETYDFTPWLSDNLGRLADVIGIPLESEGVEVAVRQFSADILAQNPADGSRVLIENQLESSDHTHLGQILTYLAGLEAQTVIWVARQFDEAHLSAVRWLNDQTAEPFAFFAVRVRVLQIADSPFVPVFEVVERPSQWDRQLRTQAAKSMSELSQHRHDFWTYHGNRYPDDGIPLGASTSSAWISIEASGLIIAPYLAQWGVGLCLRGSRGEVPEVVQQKLRRYEQALKDELGVKLGEPTSWGTYAYSELKKDSRDRDNWLEMTEWLHNRISQYRRVLENRPTSRCT